MLLIAFVVLAAVSCSHGNSTDTRLSVVVREANGDELLRAALPGSGRFGISYRHSYYDAPAVERFSVARGARKPVLELVEISSPHDGVLDYYELEGDKRRDGETSGWTSLLPVERQRFETLPLIATEKGRRTLVVAGEEHPLYRADGPRHLVLNVE